MLAGALYVAAISHSRLCGSKWKRERLSTSFRGIHERNEYLGV